jgi:hypothetical protein
MFTGALSLGLAALAPADAGAQGQAAERQEVQLPRTLRAAAPIDLTGWWVAHGSEDWRWRWVVPDRGELSGVPVNAKGREVADDWDPEADEIAGLQCKAYGAAGLMRLPGRIHITWQDDNTLKIDTDAGQQTRFLKFGAPPPPASEKTWQGFSSAVWQTTTSLQPGPSEGGEAPAGGGRGGAARSNQAGQLKVLTTHLRAGFLRKNGVPYSENARMTEYYTLATSPNRDEWLVITTIVEDPEFLNEPFITSTNFKKEPDGSKWSPTTCNTRQPR